jgi:adenylate kinase family enzyme
MPAYSAEPRSPSIRRICVVGTTGAGKSTLAGQLSHRLHVPYLELDAIYWQPGWQSLDRECMRQRVEEATRAEAWVTDGNYSFLRDLLWQRAQAIVWLDYPLPLIFWRLWWRTWRRVLSREVLWGTNRERLGTQFFSKDSLFLWALKSDREHDRAYPRAFSSPEFSHLTVYRFQTPRKTKQWLRQISTINPF